MGEGLAQKSRKIQDSMLRGSETYANVEDLNVESRSLCTINNKISSGFPTLTLVFGVSRCDIL